MNMETVVNLPPVTHPPIRGEAMRQAARHYPFAIRKAFEFASGLEIGELDVFMPDGRHFHFGGRRPGPQAVMIVKDLGFAKRMLGGGDIGMAEAYLANEWESPDLTQFLKLFCANQDLIAKMLAGKPLAQLANWIGHFLRRNTRSGAKRNIQAHYDLGNEFYAAWLDPSMTYSSALYLGGENDLEQAQCTKYRALAQEIDLKPSHHVLEIGCGWGGFAEYAAREIGCRVTGLTISQAQHDFAAARIQTAGLSDKVEIKLLDYRDERGLYDRVASIEMFEAVGEAYWPTYFAQLRDRLAPGGKAGIQSITIQEKVFNQYRREIDFIRRYIFPGGMLPTPTVLRDLGRQFGMTVTGERAFGQDYATTLAHWRGSFHKAWPGLTGLGFDEKFRRLWEYYLSYCEAGFTVGVIDVRQMVFAKS